MKQEKGEEGRSWYGGVVLLLPGKPPRRWLPLLGDSRAAGGRKRTKQPLLLGAVREEGGAVATVAAHRWRKNMWLVVVMCCSGGIRERKRRGEERERGGVFCVREGVLKTVTHPFILFILIYLFIYLG